MPIPRWSISQHSLLYLISSWTKVVTSKTKRWWSLRQPLDAGTVSQPPTYHARAVLLNSFASKSSESYAHLVPSSVYQSLIRRKSQHLFKELFLTSRLAVCTTAQPSRFTPAWNLGIHCLWHWLHLELVKLTLPSKSQYGASSGLSRCFKLSIACISPSMNLYPRLATKQSTIVKLRHTCVCSILLWGTTFSSLEPLNRGPKCRATALDLLESPRFPTTLLSKSSACWTKKRRYYKSLQ